VPTYRDVEDVTIGELRVGVSRGLAEGLAVELSGSLRSVTSRIEYEDLSGAPFTPPNPDLHHRDETLTRPGDMMLMLHGARLVAPWSLSLRAGVTIPTGKAEENPFALGDIGFEHQHIQFGTGTWDPLVGFGTARNLGKGSLALYGLARFVVSQNEHGYQAGHRLSLGAEAGHPLGETWRGRLGADLYREEAERWSGQLEEEGNLGRTDLYLAAGVMRPVAGLGSVGLTARFSLASRSSGEQVDQPVLLALEWVR